MESKELKALNNVYLEAVYGQSAGQELAKREKDDDAAGAPKKKMVVTNADKKGNTPAYQNYKKGDKRYVAADHVKEEELKEKEGYKTVAAVIDYDRSKKGTDDAVYDTEHGKKKAAKKERDYAAWEREKMKKDDPNWEHKKGSTSESVSRSVENLSNIYIEGVLKKEVKALKKGTETLKGKNIAKADEVDTQNYKGQKFGVKENDEYVPSELVQKLAESGKFSEEEIAKIVEVEEGYQRNPEKGEAEERKAEKRRKESGAMPPRGDKRREDFEKWYAANVR